MINVLERRVNIICGHFGSGKSEFAVNFANAIGDRGVKCTLCDMDVVNPYFRSREHEDELAKHGVYTVQSPLGLYADLPAIPAEVFTALQNKELYGVFDLGGDKTGARAMARFNESVDPSETHVLFVLNANRPETMTPETAIEYMNQINRTLGLNFTGIINNTHLCGNTTEEDILRGADLSEEVSLRTGIPVFCHTARTDLAEKLGGRLGDKIFPIQIYLKKPWEV